jgi:acyl-CoA synthetase (NDP forming)
MERSGIPVAVSVNQDWVAKAFRTHDVPVFESERAAMRGLALFAQYAEMREAALSEPVKPAAAAARAGATTVTLDEPASLGELAAARLPVVEHVVCRSHADVRAAIARMAGPLVAKGVSSDLTHKSEHGLVRLGICTEQEALQAFADFSETLERLAVQNGGMLLARQHLGHFELAVGAHLDPDYGPVVMVGQGGVLVEALKDVQFLVAPFSKSQARAALMRLRIAPAFGEVRGMPAVDLDGIAAMLVALGDWFVQQQGAVVSVDANPVIVARGEASPVIVDAVVIRSGEQA